LTAQQPWISFLFFVILLHEMLQGNFILNVFALYMFWILTGSTIQACHATYCYILAFKGDKAIFDTLIAPSLLAIVVPEPEPPQAMLIDQIPPMRRY